MLHFHSIQEVELANAWVTIGMYDGVHRGHQAILAPLVAEAHAAGHPAVVVTFFPHPAVTLRGIEGPLYLTTPEERAELLGEQGVDAVITLTFDRELAAMSAGDFMSMLRAHLGLSQLWVGSDFALGRNRQGDIPTLTRLGEEMGYAVNVTPDVTVDGMRVSSSLIRDLVRQGNVEEADRLLGRLYPVCGPIIHGEARGRTIGFPTANIEYWPLKIIPGNGIYATWIWIDGKRLPSVSNVGTRPTFNGSGTKVEAYLMDFNQDVYGKQARLEFVQYQRSEERFESVDALVAQMRLDVLKAREILDYAT